MSLSITELIEIKLAEEDDFLKVRETLTRIGIASRKDPKLFQSCHINYFCFLKLKNHERNENDERKNPNQQRRNLS